MGINDRDYVRKEGPSFLGSFIERGKVVKWLVGINVVVFIIQLLTTTARSQPFTDALLLNVRQVFHGQVWRLLTYAFLHDPTDIWHILFNMLLLWFFGSDLEDLYGPREFLAFYLSAAFLGGVVFTLVDPLGLNGPVSGDPLLAHRALGASGAVTAVLVLCAFHFPRRVIYVMFLLPVPIWLFVVFCVAMDLYTLLRGADTGIAVSIHVGGAAFAFLYYRLHWRIDGTLKQLWPNVQHWRKRAVRPRLRVYREEPRRKSEAITALPAAVASSSEEDQIKAEMDAVLEKISRVGRDNLTPHEEAVLQRASEILRRRRS
ncbi:MAG TPA: rhomboid family intramembrane serine protease [Gemmataceae bacterium]|nr:rhomboid family intramembrane serine protease [Gemmataceae bacterium]